MGMFREDATVMRIRTLPLGTGGTVDAIRQVSKLINQSKKPSIQQNISVIFVLFETKCPVTKQFMFPA